MVKFLSVAALTAPACALFMLAQPVVAADRSSSTAGTETKSAAGNADDGRKYCLSAEALTGSRLQRRMCKTKQEWAQEGVEVAAKK